MSSDDISPMIEHFNKIENSDDDEENDSMDD